MRLTLILWFAATMMLAIFAPGAKEFESSSIASLPDDAKSVIAQAKADQYFEASDGTPAILVFQNPNGAVELTELSPFLEQLEQMKGIQAVVPLLQLPPQAIGSFLSEDESTLILPVTFEPSLETKELKTAQEAINDLNANTTGYDLYVTGPAGIAVDTLNLFSRADIVLLLSTVGLILVLLVVIYRSPLLALIPLLAAAFVYEVVNQVLGLMGSAGLFINNQTLSIMTILLFAAVIDYSLFVFSRFREELKRVEDKFEAMRAAMRETGLPVFFSGGTVLAAMLVLFFAEYGDYRNFAPIFATTMLIIMFASITLVPALFTWFGRKSFWPYIPKVGDETVKASSFWSRIGRFVVRKPVLSAAVITVFLAASAANLANLQYEFDTMKSFPKDMPSRVGYELLREKFEKGDLAPTTVIYEASEPVSEEQRQALADLLLEQPLVSQVGFNGSADEGKVVQFRLTFDESPYAVETMDALETIIEKSDRLLKSRGLDGSIYFAGETAAKIDDRSVNNRDLPVIVALEAILILALLIVMTQSVRMPLYMMGTILVSFLAALGLGLLLSSLFFDISTISNRVPVYSFVFLVALGIDYNIILISRFLEERKRNPVGKAVEIAVATTGGVISSAGIILAATFAVLMTQPVEVLFVFGFIVAVGILLDTFLIRGILLPSLLVLFEKDKAVRKEKISSV
jgi:RND superfamily putative drug exporter